jgi:hypothetical protein
MLAREHELVGPVVPGPRLLDQPLAPSLRRGFLSFSSLSLDRVGVSVPTRRSPRRYLLAKAAIAVFACRLVAVRQRVRDAAGGGGGGFGGLGGRRLRWPWRRA